MATRNGTRTTTIDVWYELYRLIVELDGRVDHNEIGRFRDLRRDNASTVAGNDTLRYGWTDTVTASCAVAAEVAIMLQRNGWPGQPTPCGPDRAIAEAAA